MARDFGRSVWCRARFPERAEVAGCGIVGFVLRPSHALDRFVDARPGLPTLGVENEVKVSIGDKAIGEGRYSPFGPAITSQTTRAPSALLRSFPRG
jgi:hypothetical protein